MSQQEFRGGIREKSQYNHKVLWQKHEVASFVVKVTEVLEVFISVCVFTAGFPCTLQPWSVLSLLPERCTAVGVDGDKSANQSSAVSV